MEIGDWITLFAVVVALGIGISSIVHTNILYRKERRERLLNEIINWAMSFTKYSFIHKYSEMFNIRGTETKKLKAYVDIIEHRQQLQNLFSGQSVYIYNVSLSLHSNVLTENIQKMVKLFGEYVACLNELSNNINLKSDEIKGLTLEDYQEMEDKQVAIDKCAYEIIEEVVEIKHRL